MRGFFLEKRIIFRPLQEFYTQPSIIITKYPLPKRTKLAKSNKTLETKKDNSKGQLSLKAIRRHSLMLGEDLQHSYFRKMASPLHGRPNAFLL